MGFVECAQYWAWIVPGWQVFKRQVLNCRQDDLEIRPGISCMHIVRRQILGWRRRRRRQSGIRRVVSPARVETARTPANWLAQSRRKKESTNRIVSLA